MTLHTGPFALTLLLCAAISSAAVAQSDPAQVQLDWHKLGVTAPQDRNAALLYAYLLPRFQGKDELLNFDWDKALPDPPRPEAVTPEFESLVKFADPELMANLRAVTALKKCDFEPPLENGLATEMPLLSELRRAGKILRIDVRDAMVRKDAARAVDDIIALLRMSRHAATHRMGIASMVSMSIAGYAVSEGTVLANNLVLSAEQRKTIQGAIDDAGSDPFLARAARERDVSVLSAVIMSHVAASKTPGAEFLAQYPFVPNDQEEAIKGMSVDQVRDILSRWAAYEQQHANVRELPTADAELVSLYKAAEQGEYGPIAVGIGQGKDRLWRDTVENERKLREFRALLDGKAPSDAAK